MKCEILVSDIQGVSEKTQPTLKQDSSGNNMTFYDFNHFEAYHLKVKSIFFEMISRLGASIEFCIAYLTFV